jgi:hypothetical protein
MIQSSGMGKTKLLYELRKVLNKDETTFCELCFSGDVNMLNDVSEQVVNKEGIYSVVMNLHRVILQCTNELGAARRKLWEKS